MEQIIVAFEKGITDPMHQGLIQQPRVNEFPKVVEKVRAINPYQQSASNKATLLSMGIHSDPMASQTHVHPACKAIENSMLDTFAKLTRTEAHLTCLYLKPAKLRLIRRRPDKTILINKNITGKDLTRYPPETIVKSWSGQVKTNTAFMHDSLHYHTPEEIYQLFDTNPELTALYATCVLPVEALHNHPSLYRKLYNLEYPDKDTFIFIPDGHGGGAYVQPRKGLKWLEIDHIQGKFTLTVDKLETKGAHHLFLIQRGDLLTPGYNHYGFPDLITLPEVYYRDTNNCKLPMTKEFYMKMVTYVHSVSDNSASGKKIITSRDIWAKLRQVIETDALESFPADQLLLLVDYLMVIASLNNVCPDKAAIGDSIFYKCLNKPIEWIGELKRYIFGETLYDAHARLLKPNEYTYRTQTRTYFVPTKPAPTCPKTCPLKTQTGPKTSTAPPEKKSAEDITRGKLFKKIQPEENSKLHARGRTIAMKRANEKPHRDYSNYLLGHTQIPISLLEEAATSLDRQYLIRNKRTNETTHIGKGKQILEISDSESTQSSSQSETEDESITSTTTSSGVNNQDSDSDTEQSPTIPTKRESTRIECPNNLIALPADGTDNMCFYHSLQQLLQLAKSPYEIKEDCAKYALTKNHGKTLDAETIQHYNSPTPTSDTAVELAAQYYQVQLCIHQIGTTCIKERLGQGPVHHIQLVSGHFQPLIPATEKTSQTGGEHQTPTPNPIDKRPKQGNSKSRATAEARSEHSSSSTSTTNTPSKIRFINKKINLKKRGLPVLHAIHNWAYRSDKSTLANYNGFAGYVAALYDEQENKNGAFKMLAHQHRTAGHKTFTIRVKNRDVTSYFADESTVYTLLGTIKLDHKEYDIPAIGTGVYKKPINQLIATLEKRKEKFNIHLAETNIAPEPETSWNNPSTNQILKSLGFEARNGNGINPIIYQQVKTTMCLPEGPCSDALANLAAKLQRRFYPYKPNKLLASNYASDLKNNRVGTLAIRHHRKVPVDKLAHIIENTEPKARPMLVIAGAGGAGKSKSVENFITQLGLEHQSNQITIVCPTVALQTDWLKRLKPQHTFIVKTYENALEDLANPLTILDDASKLPPGYLDAYLQRHTNVESLIVTIDPKQSIYHVANQDAKSAHSLPDVDRVKQLSDYYINATHRNPKIIATPLGVYSEREGGTVHWTNNIGNDPNVILAPSRVEVAALNEAGRRAYTYSGCQGLTCPVVDLHLTPNTPKCSDRVLYTALSRASEGIRFVNTYSNDKEFLEKLEATPYLKTFLTLTKETIAEEPQIVEHKAPERITKTHLPIEREEAFIGKHLDSLKDKQDREMWSSRTGSYTNTVTTELPLVQAIPRHQTSDDALFERTINARIKIAEPIENQKDTTNALRILTAKTLWLNYSQRMQLPKTHSQPFNNELWQACRLEIEQTYLDKAKGQLKAAIRRQDPDLLDNKVSLFLKGQWVQKPEKFAAARNKPGQTIAAFKQETVLRTGTLARYIRRAEEKYRPKYIYLDCEKTPDDLKNFIKENWIFDGRKTHVNDYQQFDQSQDATIKLFEIEMMKYWSIPAEEMDFYLFLKDNAKTFLGNLKIMRLTGEGPTWDFNTRASIAFDCTKYRIPHGMAAMYAGDDSARNGVCPENESWKAIAESLTLTAKAEHVDHPLFCGWRIYKQGVIKDPLKLYISIRRAQLCGEGPRVIRSYRNDLLHAYNLGDTLTEMLDEEQLTYHQLSCRLLHIEAHARFCREEGDEPPEEFPDEIETASIC